jgi:hypothetical protein
MLVVCSHGSTLSNILFLLAHTTCTTRCNKGKTYWHITPRATPMLIQFFPKDLSIPGFHQAHTANQRQLPPQGVKPMT